MNDNNWIKSKLDKLEDKVDKLSEIAVQNTEILKVHEQRSTTNEANLDLLRKEFNPVKNHVLIVNIIFKTFTGLLAICSAIFGILKYFK